MHPQFDHSQIARYLKHKMLPVEVEIFEQRLEAEPVLLAELKSYARIHELELPERWLPRGMDEAVMSGDPNSNVGGVVVEAVHPAEGRENLTAGHFGKMPRDSDTDKTGRNALILWTMIVLLLILTGLIYWLI